MKQLHDKRMNYASLFWVFMAGSVLGFIVEGLWCVLRKGAWENHVATVWGPLCLVYGVGGGGHLCHGRGRLRVAANKAVHDVRPGRNGGGILHQPLSGDLVRLPLLGL